MSLTARQCEILKAIIEEYIKNAQPIGSVELVETRRLPISGATVRNIMSDLVRQGYLSMLHVSSGRVPNERAYRYYITELMEEEPITVLEEISMKQKLWNARYELERLLKSATEVLSDIGENLAFALTNDGFSIYSGASKMLERPEFYEIDVTKSVLRFVDSYDLMKSIVESNASSSDVTILIGREIGLANMDPVSLSVVKSTIDNKDCYVGLIGPARINYNKVIPVMRHIKYLLDEVGQSI